MTLEGLRVFAVAAELLNLSATARQLGCSQPAVSQHISKLERELGVELLERSTRGVVLTPAGRAFHRQVVEGLDAFAAAERIAEQFREGASGSLGIATGGTTVRHFMQQAVVAFKRLHPRVSFSIQSANSSLRCIEALVEDRADLAFITIGPARRRVEQLPVVEMPWVLLVPANDPLAHLDTPPRARDLASIRYIGLPSRSTSGEQLERALGQEGVTLASTTLVDDWDTAALLVELGLGHAIAPALHGFHLARERAVRALPLRFLPSVTFGWAARRFDALVDPARDFVELVHSSLAEERYVEGLRVLAPGAQPIARLR